MSGMDDDFKIQGMAEHKWSFAVKLDGGSATLLVESDADVNFAIGTLTHPDDTDDGMVRVEVDRDGAAMFIAETIRAALSKSKKVH